MGTPLPYILGHENAGWVHEVGSAVTNVAVGDTVILHPTPTCGLCHACRAGDDMHCENSTFPGLSTDGGMADYLLTSARACVKLDPKTQPKDVAALAITMTDERTDWSGPVLNAFSDDTYGLFELAEMVRTSLGSSSPIVDETENISGPVPAFDNARAKRHHPRFRALRDHLQDIPA